MRGNRILSQPLAKMMSHALRETPRVDKNQRRAMLPGQRGDALVDFVPHFVGSHGAQLASRNFDGQIEFTPVTYFDHHWSGPSGAAEKMGDQFDRLLRRGKTYARESFASQVVETFEGKRQVRAAFVVRDCVNLVDDHRLYGSEHLAALRGGPKDIEGLRSCDQDVRWSRRHRASLTGERVSRAHGRAYVRHEDSALAGELKNFTKGNFQIFLNVVA